MSVNADGTQSPLWDGNRDAGPWPSQGEDVDATQGDMHLRRMADALDALIRRMGLDSDPDGTAWGAFNTLAERLTSIGGGGGGIDHGALGGLADDDHPQYHNDARGDARYYQKTELDAGQLDNRYFREDEHLDVSAGAGDAGKPIKLNGAGEVDASMIPDPAPVNKSVFIAATDYDTDRAGFSYRGRQFPDTLIGPQDSHVNFTFATPEDIEVGITSIEAVLATGTIAPGNGVTLDLDSDYAAGGGANLGTFQETTSIVENLPNASAMYYIDVSACFATLLGFTAASQRDVVAGLEISFPASLSEFQHWLGIRVNYQ